MFHGEYKTPGGKLVVTEFSVEQDRLKAVAVSGDFFLYPEDLLETITGALEGLPVSLDEDAIAARVRAAIPAGGEVLGTSPAGIAISVRRALAGGSKA